MDVEVELIDEHTLLPYGRLVCLDALHTRSGQRWSCGNSRNVCFPPTSSKPGSNKSVIAYSLKEHSYNSAKVRANQRDLFHVASLREQLDVLLRTSFGEFCVVNGNTTYVNQGTRWLLRWEKEIEFFSKLAYFGLTTRYGGSLFI